jgi:hypothetical protein
MKVRAVVFGFVVLLAANEPGRTDIAWSTPSTAGTHRVEAPTRTAAFAAADKIVSVLLHLLYRGRLVGLCGLRSRQLVGEVSTNHPDGDSGEPRRGTYWSKKTRATSSRRVVTPVLLKMDLRWSWTV